MKYSFTHKINLANIDRELWPYETEDISISDADSFDEARQQVDKLVAERIGYYKAISETERAKRANTPSGTPTMAPVRRPPLGPTPTAPAATAPAPAVPVRPQTAPSNVPPEFQV